MRLTCPNCGARYEVDDAMIPPDGRDVQCSECSTTWFQPGRSAAPPPETTPAPGAVQDRAGDAPPPAEEPVRTDAGAAAGSSTADPDHAPSERAVRSGPGDAPRTPDPEPVADPAPKPEREPEPEAAVPPEVRIPASAEVATRVVPPNDTPEEPETADDPEASDVSARRPIDPAIRDILREEAEREARLRREEAAPVETQGEMPLEEHPLTQSRRARRRADLEDAEDIFAAGVAKAAQASASRRDLLPDIEEINSTLRATEPAEPQAEETVHEAPRRISRRGQGVRIGFILTLLLAGVAFYVYANADFVASRVPQLAPELTIYRDTVDDLRFRLDDFARQLVEESATPPE